MRQGLLDTLSDLMMLDPFRCNSCNYRFFRYRQRWARYVVPAVLCCLLSVVVVMAMNVKPWMRQAKQALRHQPPSQAIIDSQADRMKTKAR